MPLLCIAAVGTSLSIQVSMSMLEFEDDVDGMAPPLIAEAASAGSPVVKKEPEGAGSSDVAPVPSGQHQAGHAIGQKA